MPHKHNQDSAVLGAKANNCAEPTASVSASFVNVSVCDSKAAELQRHIVFLADDYSHY